MLLELSYLLLTTSLQILLPSVIVLVPGGAIPILGTIPSAVSNDVYYIDLIANHVLIARCSDQVGTVAHQTIQNVSQGICTNPAPRACRLHLPKWHDSVPRPDRVPNPQPTQHQSRDRTYLLSRAYRLYIDTRQWRTSRLQDHRHRIIRQRRVLFTIQHPRFPDQHRIHGLRESSTPIPHTGPWNRSCRCDARIQYGRPSYVSLDNYASDVR
jgi:hypothetical protein